MAWLQVSSHLVVMKRRAQKAWLERVWFSNSGNHLHSDRCDVTAVDGWMASHCGMHSTMSAGDDKRVIDIQASVQATTQALTQKRQYLFEMAQDAQGHRGEVMSL